MTCILKLKFNSITNPTFVKARLILDCGFILIIVSNFVFVFVKRIFLSIVYA